MKYVNYVKYVADDSKVSAVRPAHRQYADRLMAEGKMVTAGPFTDGSGGLFVYEAENQQDAEALWAADPYVGGGVVMSYEIRAWHMAGVNADLLRPGG